MNKNLIAVVDDLFFASKIRGAAEQLSIKVNFARSKESLIESALQSRPGLIICDLHSQRIDPIGLASDLKENHLLKDIPLIGYFSHVQTELQRNAEDAGFDRVVPRSFFAKNLAEILAGRI